MLANLKSEGRLTSEEELAMMIEAGIGKLSKLKNLVEQGRLTKKQSVEIGQLCKANMPPAVCRGVLSRMVKNKELKKADANAILKTMNQNYTDTNSGNKVTGNLLLAGTINANQAEQLVKSCTSNNVKSCLETLKNMIKEGTLDRIEAKQLLTKYDRPGLAELMFDNSTFGAVSNESDLKSIPPKLQAREAESTDRVSNKNMPKSKQEIESVNEMKYSQLNKDFHVPLGQYTTDFNNDFEYGYSYLNTNKWSVPLPKVPVCKSEKKCPVCPVTTTGYPVDLKDWNTSRKMLPPDNINIDYVKDKLN